MVAMSVKDKASMVTPAVRCHRERPETMIFETGAIYLQ